MIERLVIQHYSDLEWYVIQDMLDRGYDPLNRDDVVEYWNGNLN